MSSAAKFVLAGAIVAVFGGVLLTGVLTQPRDESIPAVGASASAAPMPTDPPSARDRYLDLRSRLATEEVEPGVFRILDDGAGDDMVAEPPVGLTMGLDGSVWLLRGGPRADGDYLYPSVDAAYRVGHAGMYPFEAWANWRPPDLAVDRYGVAWTIVGSQGLATLASLDGSTWASASWPDGSTGVREIAATDDGAVWVTQRVGSGAGPRVARVVDGVWTELPPLEDPSLAGTFGSDDAGPGYFAPAADGTAWLANGELHTWDPRNSTPSPNGLLHFDGTRWQVVDLPTGDRTEEAGEHPGWRAGPLALGPDGTLWVYLISDARPSPTDWNNPLNGNLARLDADGWRLFTAEDDGVPLLVIYKDFEAPMAVDGDGRLWVAPGFGGVLSFDGTRWRRYLGGLYVNRLDMAPDGSVLATALGGCRSAERAAERFTPDYEWTAAHPCSDPSDFDAGKAGLYVVDPEAVAATD